MKYKVSQRSATLGDPCAATFDSLAEAEADAAKLREEIAAMVAGWPTPDPDEPEDEIEKEWIIANRMADGARTYGEAAGAYIAEQAVVIEEIE
jgi:hypothetical protein